MQPHRGEIGQAEIWSEKKRPKKGFGNGVQPQTFLDLGVREGSSLGKEKNGGEKGRHVGWETGGASPNISGFGESKWSKGKSRE